MLDTHTLSEKICRNCRRTKSVSEFFFKKTEGRYEHRCKDCKRNGRITRRREPDRTSHDSHVRSEPMVLIEPLPPSKKADLAASEGGLVVGARDKPVDSGGCVDFELWERLYGRALNEVERIQIKTNLAAFFHVLLDEGRK
jgi:hypothetical protein